MQLPLPLLELPEMLKVEDKATFSDPSFASNKLLPVHRWVPWIAGFSSNFVREILEQKLSEPGTVLDPFAGVGTTLVEAALAGHDVVGFEINPYAALASRIKLNAHKLSSKTITEETVRLRKFYSRTIPNGYSPKSEFPIGFKTRKIFYSPTVLRKVLTIQDFIEKLNNRQVQEVFKLAFASTMIHYSNYSYEPSLGTRSAAGKSDIEDFPVINIIAEKLETIALDIGWLGERAMAVSSKCQIINASFFDCQNHIEAASVDLAITSPPYLNNYHYIRNTRPHLYWLGFAKEPKDTKYLEHQNFGKYWQTVRALDNVNLDFPNPPVELVEQISCLRTLNIERGIYGGNGWANYAAAYFNDCYKFAKYLEYALKKNSSAFVVLGNSILQGVMIPTDRYFGQIAKAVGLELVNIHIPRSARVGNSIIKSDVRVVKAQKSHCLYESVVELKKHA
ncbi:DNA methyltransferase [Synechococcus sp. PCC 7336]|uniref:DNA methyltransferase n=1 Tax=Synechococcus sp. PCC 7336 TaxID=195250 RepID=UPI00034C015B|nr:DNA methyltransferase [Synechococcus sp. PCC 7336]